MASASRHFVLGETSLIVSRSSRAIEHPSVSALDTPLRIRPRLTAHGRCGHAVEDDLRHAKRKAWESAHDEPAGVSRLSCVAGRVRAREPGVRRRRMRERPGEAPADAPPPRTRRATPPTRLAAARVRDGPAGGRAGPHVQAVHRRPRPDGGAPADPRGGRPSTAPSTSSTRACSAAWPTRWARPSRSTSTRSSRRGNATKVNVALRAAAARHAGDGADARARSTWWWPRSSIRPELQAIVDFTKPTRTNVSEVVVTGPGAPAIALGRRPVRQGRLRPQGQQRLARASSR